MPLSGDEIRKNLEAFLPRWRDFAGTERSEAQTFLNELLAAYGTDRQAAGARFEERGGTGFIDMLWPGVCIVEMKRPSEKDKLAEHREQAFGYWKRVSRDTGNAGRYVVVCATGGYTARTSASSRRSTCSATLTSESLPSEPQRASGSSFRTVRTPVSPGSLSTEEQAGRATGSTRTRPKWCNAAPSWCPFLAGVP